MISDSVSPRQLLVAGGALFGTGLMVYNWYCETSANKATNGMPGTRGTIPLVNCTLAFARNPRKFLREGFTKYGSCFRTRIMGENTICVSGVDAATLVYSNEDLFAVRMFDPLMKLLDGFVLIQNGKEHRKNRALIVRALTDSQLRRNIRGISEVFSNELQQWSSRPEGVEVYNAIKTAILKVMMKVLFGSSKLPESEINRMVTEFEYFGKGFLALVSIPRSVPIPSD